MAARKSGADVYNNGEILFLKLSSSTVCLHCCFQSGEVVQQSRFSSYLLYVNMVQYEFGTTGKKINKKSQMHKLRPIWEVQRCVCQLTLGGRESGDL